jgi:hypothetical protein
MNKSALFTRIIVTLAAVLLLGFAVEYNQGPDKPVPAEQTGLVSQAQVDSIKTGMTNTDVVAKLGPPHREVDHAVVILIYKISDDMDALVGLSANGSDIRVVSVKTASSVEADEIH